MQLSVRNLQKTYGHVKALSGIDFDLPEGEIVGLVGDNGAGKTTFIKILSGVLAPDGGSMEVAGQSIDFRRYHVGAARSLGIETVHQDRSLGEKQPIWRNFFMGRHKKNHLGFIDAGFEKAEVRKILTDTLGLSGVGMTPDAPVSILSGGERQGLAIGRAMYFDAKIVILDEPTTSLAAPEVEKVLRFVSRIREEGRSGILVSHNLAHLHRCCDRFVFFHQGQIAGTYRKEAVSPEDLVRLLTGEPHANGGCA